MAKTLKKMVYVSLHADTAGIAYGKCIVVAEIGSDDDAELEKQSVKEYTLTGQDLTDAQNLFDSCKAKVESDEGIV